ncbi:MAG: WD40/YVTN/BNR-like repeat-containing protein, partial [Planctomycetota bacterium]
MENSERIHRILLHPGDSQVAYVAALGKSWGENEQRGVFKTVDGGETWQKVLYIDERTGCADLIMDPSNPDKLFAAMWDHRRMPWTFRSGGPGSGLHMTLDGGRTWKRFSEKDGMPSGHLGRMGLGIARSNPKVVYALVEAKKSALLRSEDGGFTWQKVNEDQDNITRPFYYCDIRVDPERENRIYNLQSNVSVSEDGGKSFQPLITWDSAHPDHHAMWINPRDPEHIIEGNDGGVYISRDRGESWRFVSNLPLAQFYHIAVDMETPYNVYGGMQDNGSWRGPS